MKLMGMGYDMTIVYRSGASNLKADIMSGLPEFYVLSADPGSVATMCSVMAVATTEEEVPETPYIPELTSLTLAELQWQDPELQSLIRYLREDVLPTEPAK